ncbi:MAG TPA: 3-hydroxyacyl-CoA dehydrogenase [Desulfobacteraceae bacterium]|nr:3-hydroxyacyl-CoA dehydrogenase [Desulfobacteraceae bacterium]
MEIKGCVAVVTGGASGLGEACVRSLVDDGAKVTILDFDDKRGEALAGELGDSVLFCKTDVADGDNVQEAINKTLDAFGAVHVAINCAGVGTPFKVIGKKGPMSIDKFNRVIQINLIGTMNVIRLAAEKMLDNTPNEDGEKGVVINTASIAAFEGQIGQAAYTASKSAVVGMTLPIAREFADYGIRVLTIAPGLFETPMLAGLPEKAQQSLVKMIPFPKRLGKPSEFAKLAKHIIENPVLNAETIRLDSGIRMASK